MGSSSTASSANSAPPPPLGVRRNIRLKNTGLVPLRILDFVIENEQCQSGDFSILNCEPLTLQPDEFKDVIVAFTPDFSSTTVSKHLSIRSTLSGHKNVLNFTLQATLSAKVIAECAEMLPRPPWETYFYYCFNVSLLFGGACLLIVVYVEAGKKLRTPSSSEQRASEAAAAPFDLRGIPDQVSNELRQRKVNDAVSPSKKTIPPQEIPTWLRPRSAAPGSPRMVRRSTQHHQQSSVMKRIKCAWANLTVWCLRVWERLKARIGLVRLRQDAAEERASKVEVVESSVEPAKKVVATSAKTSASSSRLSTPVSQSRKNKKRGAKGKAQNNNAAKSSVVVPSKPDEDGETSSTTTESSNMDEDVGKCNIDLNKKSTPSNTNHPNSSSASGNAGKKGKHQNNAKGSKISNSSSNSKKDLQEPVEDVKNVNSNLAVTTKENRSPRGKQQPQQQQQPKASPTSTGEKVTPKQQQPPKENKKEAKKVVKTGSVEANSDSNNKAKGAANEQPDLSTQPKQKAKVTPVGKILPEPKKPENLGAHYGPIGTPSKTGLMVRQSTWSNTQAYSMFGGQPKQEQGVEPGSSNPLKDSPSPVVRSNSSPYHQQCHPPAEETSSLLSNNSPATLMQSLQQERKLRYKDYLMQMQTDWPGFGSDSKKRSFFDELWDSQPMGQLGQTPTWGAASGGSWSPSNDPWTSSPSSSGLRNEVVPPVGHPIVGSTSGCNERSLLNNVLPPSPILSNSSFGTSVWNSHAGDFAVSDQVLLQQIQHEHLRQQQRIEEELRLLNAKSNGNPWGNNSNVYRH
jgi:hypothetical protein